MSDASHDPTQCSRVKLVKFSVIRANGGLKESFEMRKRTFFSSRGRLKLKADCVFLQVN